MYFGSCLFLLKLIKTANEKGFLKNSSGILEEFFENFQGGKIDNYLNFCSIYIFKWLNGREWWSDGVMEWWSDGILFTYFRSAAVGQSTYKSGMFIDIWVCNLLVWLGIIIHMSFASQVTLQGKVGQRIWCWLRQDERKSSLNLQLSAEQRRWSNSCTEVRYVYVNPHVYVEG